MGAVVMTTRRAFLKGIGAAATVAALPASVVKAAEAIAPVPPLQTGGIVPAGNIAFRLLDWQGRCVIERVLPAHKVYDAARDRFSVDFLALPPMTVSRVQVDAGEVGMTQDLVYPLSVGNGDTVVLNWTTEEFLT
jgi:hypothetical protein